MYKAEQLTITQALKPCPFCGGEAELRENGYQVHCATGCTANVNDDYAPEAIAAWNARTTSLAAQDGLVEALQFYANHLSFPLNAWVQPTKVDYSLGGDGHWPDGPPIPSSALLADQGRIARKALSAIKEQHHD